jgi:tetratricopeptide (TPR) repeat protein
MVQAGEALRNSQPQAQDQVDALLRRYSMVWQGKLAEMEEEKVKPGPKIRTLPQLPPWLILLLGVTAEPLHAETAYLLALCKHEQAERLQIRFKRNSNDKSALQAWESARQLWNDFLEKHPNRPQAAAARLWLARALEALNEPEAAVALLQDPKNLTPLEKTARLYQARMMKQK